MDTDIQGIKIRLEIGLGEALDRLSIFKIKYEKTGEKIFQEQLDKLSAQITNWNDEVHDFYLTLLAVNNTLWELEDEIRTDIDVSRAAELAYDIIEINDKRSRVKLAVDLLNGEKVFDRKFYNEIKK